jgi:hypothetical protein
MAVLLGDPCKSQYCPSVLIEKKLTFSDNLRI